MFSNLSSLLFSLTKVRTFMSVAPGTCGFNLPLCPCLSVLKSLSAMFVRSPFHRWNWSLQPWGSMRIHEVCHTWEMARKRSVLLQFLCSHCSHGPALPNCEARDDSSLWTLSEESGNTLGLQWVLLHCAEFRSRQEKAVEIIGNHKEKPVFWSKSPCGWNYTTSSHRIGILT